MILDVPKGDLLRLIWSELKLLPPDQVSDGVSVVITCPPEGDEGVGAVVAACVEKVALPLVMQVPAPLAPEQAVTSQR
jgi:hypothetical protein